VTDRVVENYISRWSLLLVREKEEEPDREAPDGRTGHVIRTDPTMGICERPWFSHGLTPQNKQDITTVKNPNR
jgi:hypothetical protein